MDGKQYLAENVNDHRKETSKEQKRSLKERDIELCLDSVDELTIKLCPPHAYQSTKMYHTNTIQTHLFFW